MQNAAKTMEHTRTTKNLRKPRNTSKKTMQTAAKTKEKHEKQQRAEIMNSQHCSELEAVFTVADGLGSTK